MSKRKKVFAINWMEVDALVKGKHDDPHHILGAHPCIDDLYVNVYLPDAKVVKVKDRKTGKTHSLVSERVPGFFSICIPSQQPFDYTVEAKFEDGHEESYIDPYIFEPVVDPIDISLFNEGIHDRVYEKMGSHPMEVDGVKGTLFAVWAPKFPLSAISASGTVAAIPCANWIIPVFLSFLFPVILPAKSINTKSVPRRGMYS